MCYHTTFLFFLCGHTSISPRPVRNTPKCQDEPHTTIQCQMPKLSTADLIQARGQQQVSKYQNHETSSPRTATSRLSYHSITSPFPSPQEYEFAQQAHDVSIPATPVSPSILKKQSFQSARSGSTDILASYEDSASTCPVTQNSTPQCSVVACHPMHTYILPQLCPTCRLQREQNMARFELQTMKEAIDREQWDYRKGSGPMGVVDNQRKIIRRRSACKGKLIPLICVEENKIGMEVLKEQARAEEFQRQNQDNSARSDDWTESENEALRSDNIADMSQSPASQTTNARASDNALSVWARSWWTKNANSTSNSTVTSRTSTPLQEAFTDLRPKAHGAKELSEVSPEGLAIEITPRSRSVKTSQGVSAGVDWSGTRDLEGYQDRCEAARL